MNTRDQRAEQNSEPHEPQFEAIAPGECKPVRVTLKKSTGAKPGFFCVDKYNCWMMGGVRKKYI